MWGDLWNTPGVGELYWRAALQGRIGGENEALFRALLPRKAKILEAGCGVGQVVLALRQWGHDCWGLDYAGVTIGCLKGRFPDVPFIQGDIRALPFEDASFDAYISLGVIEHFTSGQEIMLAEAARIVRPGGTIFLSVPALNSYRELRIRLGTYDRGATKPFFEACYGLAELQELLRESGFEPLEHHYQNTVMTFAQETPLRPLYRLLEDTRYPRSAVDRVLRLLLPRRWFGHMLMVVGRRI
jgi:ubiquinone/menaquinone biosynthesis C-methylase UbiE